MEYACIKIWHFPSNFKPENGNVVPIVYSFLAEDSNDMTSCKHLMEMIDTNDDPVVLKNTIADWPASSWTPDSLVTVFKNEPLSFRIGSSFYNGMS